MKPLQTIALPALVFLALVGCSGPAQPGNSSGADTATTAAVDTATVLNGHVRKLGPDGRLLLEGDMLDGKRTGLWTSYTADGRVKSRGEYRDGAQEGLATVFHDNGALYYTGRYLRGEQVGEWRFYDRQGNLVRTVAYDTAGAVINDHPQGR